MPRLISRAPYYYRRFLSWQDMRDDGHHGFADTDGCLDALDLLPNGASDNKEDLPSPTYVLREEDNHGAR